MTRPTYNVTNGLLSRQLATITDTLLKANQRRDTNLRDRVNMSSKETPMMHTNQSRHALSVTSELGLSRAASSGRSSLGFEYEDEDGRAITGEQQCGDLAKQRHTDLHGTCGTDRTNILETLLAEFQHDTPSSSEAETEDGYDDANDLHAALSDVLAIDTSKSIGDDTREMLREVDGQSLIVKSPDTAQVNVYSSSDPKAMLTDLDGGNEVSGQDRHEDDGYLETTDRKSATAHLPPNRSEHQVTLYTTEVIPTVDIKGTSRLRFQEDMAHAIDPNIIPYAVALTLESAGCKWEKINGWCTYLFGSGTNESTPEQEMKVTSQNQNEKADVTTTHTEDGKNYLRRRLMLSNLAAGVEVHDIRMFFRKYYRDIYSVTLLPERDLVRRTRSAYVDMYSRKAAVYASFEVGQIFGLVVKIKLAVE